MRNSSKVLIAAIAVVLGLGVFLNRAAIRKKSAADEVQSRPRLSRTSNASGAFTDIKQKGSMLPSHPIPARTKVSPAELEDLWRGFQSSYGIGLNAVFTDDRRVASIRSGDEPATPAPGFQSGDRDAALARAREILTRASDLIGLNRAFPLQAASIRSDDISSQIEWIQTFGGVPIEPYGRVTMQLDAQGGLRGLDSSYISDPVIGNQASLSADQARNSAVSSLGDQLEHPDQVVSGQLILFAAGPQSGDTSVKLRYAYRFSVEGRQVIVDASNGKILHERDEREY